MLDKISVFLNLPRLVLCPIMWSTLENIPCALKKNVYSDGMLPIYKLSPSCLIYHETPALPYWFSFWIIYPLMLVGCWSPLLLLCYCHLLLLCPLIFALSYIGCIYIYNCYIFLDWSLDHLMSFFVSCNIFYLKSFSIPSLSVCVCL